MSTLRTLAATVVVATAVGAAPGLAPADAPEPASALNGAMSATCLWFWWLPIPCHKSVQ